MQDQICHRSLHCHLSCSNTLDSLPALQHTLELDIIQLMGLHRVNVITICSKGDTETTLRS